VVRAAQVAAKPDQAGVEGVVQSSDACHRQVEM
jgi:hypothetical protein